MQCLREPIKPKQLRVVVTSKIPQLLYIYDQHQEFKKETELKAKCTVYIVSIFCSHLINLHTKLNEIKELKRREYTN